MNEFSEPCVKDMAKVEQLISEGANDSNVRMYWRTLGTRAITDIQGCI